MTYIIDTVLVTVLSKAMAFRYRDVPWLKMGPMVVLVLSLALVWVGGEARGCE